MNAYTEEKSKKGRNSGNGGGDIPGNKSAVEGGNETSKETKFQELLEHLNPGEDCKEETIPDPEG